MTSNGMKVSALAVIVAFTLVSCATTFDKDASIGTKASASTIENEFAIESLNSTPVDAAAYNRMIAAQGFEYYCGSGVCDKVPTLISGHTPNYPPDLQASGIVGSATVIFVINEQGNVVDKRVEFATHSEFAEAALRAVASWKFNPASLNGEPVPLTSRQKFPFDLR